MRYLTRFINQNHALFGNAHTRQYNINEIASQWQNANQANLLINICTVNCPRAHFTLILWLYRSILKWLWLVDMESLSETLTMHMCGWGIRILINFLNAIRIAMNNTYPGKECRINRENSSFRRQDLDRRET